LPGDRDCHLVAALRVPAAAVAVALLAYAEAASDSGAARAVGF
jgi:hypothetical protein